jgi:hydrogenase-4 component B
VQGGAEIHLMKFFEETLYLPAARIVNSLSGRVSRLQNWNLDTYVAYVFIAAVLIMVYVGWFV